MRLTHLTISGLKGAEALEVDLAPKQIFIGPNGTGKSRVRQALEAVALGEVLDQGKTADKILRLATNGEIKVRGVLDDAPAPDFAIHRAWSAEQGYRVQATGARGARGGKSAVNAAIEARLGLVRPLLAIDEWLSLGSVRRRRELFTWAASAQGFDLAEIAERIARDVEGDLRLPSIEGELVETWLGAAIDAAKKAAKKAEDKATALEATLARGREQLAEAVEPDDEQRAHLAELIDTRGELRRRLAEYEKAAGRRKALQGKLTGLLDKRGEAFSRLLSLPAAPTAEEWEQARAELGEAEEALEDVAQQDAETLEALREAERSGERLGAALATAEGRLVAYRAGVCHCCGSSFEDVDEFEILTQESQIVDLTNEIEAHRAALARIEQDRQDLASERRVLTQYRDNVAEKLSAYRTREESAGTRATLEAYVADLDAQIEAVEAEVSDLDESPEDLRAELERVELEIEKAETLGADWQRLFDQVQRDQRDIDRAILTIASCKRLEAALGPNGVQGEIATKVLQPLVEAANELVEAAGYGLLDAVTEQDKQPVLDLCLVRPDGARIPIDTLSGGESAAAYAALTYGFARVTGANWRPVVVDNVERLDYERRERFLAALGELVDKGEHIDQAIVLGCPDKLPKAEGWKITHTGGVATA